MSEFEFQSALRERTSVIVALAGASGSGKTFTALQLALGLAGIEPSTWKTTDKARIAVVGSEGRRALHYAPAPGERPDFVNTFPFDHMELTEPYSPERWLMAFQAAEKAGYLVIVADSFSDEYVGSGGIVDMKEAELANMRIKNDAAAWAKPKTAHKKVTRWMRSSNTHLIVCLRAEEKVKLEKITKDGREQTVVIPIGWQPSCEKTVPYEMMTSIMLHPFPDTPGVPFPIKIEEQHRAFFPPDRPITRDAGRALAAWAAGAPVPVAENPAIEAANRIADEGTEQFRLWWKGINKSHRDLLRGDLPRLEARAGAADQLASADAPLSGHKSEATIGIDDMKSDLHNSQLSAAGKAGGSPVEGVESSHLDTEKSEASADAPPLGAGTASVSSAVPASSHQELSDGASGRGERAADVLCLAPVQSSEGSAATDAPRGSDNDPPPAGGEAAGARGGRREPVADAAYQLPDDAPRYIGEPEHEADKIEHTESRPIGEMGTQRSVKPPVAGSTPVSASLSDPPLADASEDAADRKTAVAPTGVAPSSSLALQSDQPPAAEIIGEPVNEVGEITKLRLRSRLTEAASKGLKYFDWYWIHFLPPEERALAAPMCGHYREIAMKATP